MDGEEGDAVTSHGRARGELDRAGEEREDRSRQRESHSVWQRHMGEIVYYCFNASCLLESIAISLFRRSSSLSTRGSHHSQTVCTEHRKVIRHRRYRRRIARGKYGKMRKT